MVYGFVTDTTFRAHNALHRLIAALREYDASFEDAHSPVDGHARKRRRTTPPGQPEESSARSQATSTATTPHELPTFTPVHATLPAAEHPQTMPPFMIEDDSKMLSDSSIFASSDIMRNIAAFKAPVDTADVMNTDIYNDDDILIDVAAIIARNDKGKENANPLTAIDEETEEDLWLNPTVYERRETEQRAYEALKSKFGRSRASRVSPLQPSATSKVDPLKRIDNILTTSSLRALTISDESKAEMRNLHRKVEEARLAEKRKPQTTEKSREIEAKFFVKKEAMLRASKGPREIIPNLPEEWIQRVSDTIGAPEGTVLATTCQGIPLHRRDFITVVAAKSWLNDEIVNGALAELDKQINLANGVFLSETYNKKRKSLVLNSFFWPKMMETRGRNSQRWLRRAGVLPSSFLDLDIVLIPICEAYHWTLLALKPRQRTVVHMDSFNRSSTHPQLAIEWMKDLLGKDYTEPWTVEYIMSPHQTNSYDCGVHTITNAMCLALGLDPMTHYSSPQLPLQRLRIAGMFLNGGFEGEFTLWKE
ncbi:Ubiquitin-like-specific protease ESD4 [Trichoderma ghanense]|uniref:Ubiquitin-like-specific protease ESD4 n=1 Tax=Trichoderma ghanense TaxID=65468 RepID=A0ABY2GP07_9HYPO